MKYTNRQKLTGATESEVDITTPLTILIKSYTGYFPIKSTLAVWLSYAQAYNIPIFFSFSFLQFALHWDVILDQPKD